MKRVARVRKNYNREGQNERESVWEYGEGGKKGVGSHSIASGLRSKAIMNDEAQLISRMIFIERILLARGSVGQEGPSFAI